MAKIVGAFGVSHIMFSRAVEPEMADRVFDGYAEVGRRVRASRPDLVVMISGDHLLNLGGGIQVPFGVGIGAEWTAFGDMGIPQRPRPGQPEFARGLARFLAQAEFDVAMFDSDAFHPDHGYTCPMLFNDPGHQLPYVPVHIDINQNVPSAERCWRLGEAIGRYVREQRPSAERVVIEATGGLSHWLRMEGDGTIAEEFDLWTLDRIVAGDLDALRQLTTEEIFERAGNGGLELLFWLTMLAAVGDAPTAEKVFYEPMVKWNTGLAGIDMKVAA